MDEKRANCQPESQTGKGSFAGAKGSEATYGARLAM